MRQSVLLSVAGLAAAVSGASSAQVVINEVMQNPPLSDTAWEFIELYGRPGMSLNGYAIGLFKGGADPDGDDVANTATEIDEAFSLDGLSLSDTGFLTLVNTRLGTPESAIFVDEGSNLGGFAEAHIPAPDTQGQLANGDSSTYLLMRARPNYRFENGESVYLPGYAIRKEGIPDSDFDGKLDFGFESPAAEQHDPLQVVDDIAWSNNGGKEYVRSSEQEISDTPGFDPDAVSRVQYFGANPMLGHRVNGDGEVVPTRMADESFVYGEVQRLPISLDTLPEFGTELDAGELVVPKSPTDPNGPRYECPPVITSEADCFQSPTGTFLFDDLPIFDGTGSGEFGFNLTPGTFNDDARFGITQFRFTANDFDFDGDVDSDDLALIQARVGATLDDLIDCTDDDTGMPIINPDTNEPFQCYEFQGRGFNAIEAMRHADPTDGPGGTNAEEVTMSDLMVIQALVPADRLCADVNDDGILNGADFNSWLTAFSQNSTAADQNFDGNLNGADFNAWLTNFSQGEAGPTCNP